MGRLDGKVALTSGGARGMGATEARMFTEEGASVIFGDVLDELGAQVESQIRELGGESTYLHLDVTNSEDWKRAIGVAESKYGRLDILVNNAGILRRYSIEETTEEVWNEIIAVNATGVFLGTKYAIPVMRRAGGGSIVNISSMSGMVGVGPPAYVASKGAVRLFTKSTAIQYAKENIRCNSVHPGSVDTPMRQIALAESGPSQFAGVSNPLGKIGTAEDIAYGVLYLASDEASFVTGSELVIDGGSTAQ